MLLAWNASSAISKQKDCKNKKTWLTQTALCKYFSLFHITYIKDMKKNLKNYFLAQNLFYIKRFSKEIVIKFSKNVERKIANDPKIS